MVTRMGIKNGLIFSAFVCLVFGRTGFDLGLKCVFLNFLRERKRERRERERGERERETACRKVKGRRQTADFLDYLEDFEV